MYTNADAFWPMVGRSAMSDKAVQCDIEDVADLRARLSDTEEKLKKTQSICKSLHHESRKANERMFDFVIKLEEILRFFREIIQPCKVVQVLSRPIWESY